MKIATLDVNLALPAQATLRFSETTSLADCNVLLWDPMAGLAQFEGGLEQVDPPVLSLRASSELLRISRHWRAEFASLVRRGGALVVMLSSGHAPGIHTYQEVIPYQPLEPLDGLLRGPVHVEAGGPYAAHAIGGEPFRRFFEFFAGDLCASVALTRHCGMPVLSGEQGQVLGAYCAIVPGCVLFMPKPSGTLMEDEERSEIFIQQLSRALDRLGFGAGTALASWSAQVATAQEQDLSERRDALLRTIADLQVELNGIRSALLDIDFYKQLFAGTDRGTRVAVAELLRAKGYIVHGDWLDESLLIVETGDSLQILDVALQGGVDDAQAKLLTLTHARDRVQDYFGKPTSAALVDCRRNGLPLEMQHADSGLASFLAESHMQYVTGLELYGWHVDAQNTAWLFGDRDGTLRQDCDGKARAALRDR